MEGHQNLYEQGLKLFTITFANQGLDRFIVHFKHLNDIL